MDQGLVVFFLDVAKKAPLSFEIASYCYERKKTVGILCSDEEQQSTLDTFLWTYRQRSFIPHASIHSPLASESPVLLSCHFSDILHASVCISLKTKRAVCSLRSSQILIELVGLEERQEARVLYQSYHQIGQFVQHTSSWEELCVIMENI